MFVCCCSSVILCLLAVHMDCVTFQAKILVRRGLLTRCFVRDGFQRRPPYHSCRATNQKTATFVLAALTTWSLTWVVVCGSDSFSALGRGLVIVLAFPMVLFEAWQLAKCSLPVGVVKFPLDSSPAASMQRGSCVSELLELPVSWIEFLMGHFGITSGNCCGWHCYVELVWGLGRCSRLLSFIHFYVADLCFSEFIRCSACWCFFYNSLKYALCTAAVQFCLRAPRALDRVSNAPL
jgi:hypothetical protein